MPEFATAKSLQVPLFGPLHTVPWFCFLFFFDGSGLFGPYLGRPRFWMMGLVYGVCYPHPGCQDGLWAKIKKLKIRNVKTENCTVINALIPCVWKK